MAAHLLSWVLLGELAEQTSCDGGTIGLRVVGCGVMELGAEQLRNGCPQLRGEL